MGTFAIGIDGFAKRTGESVDKIVRSVCVQASTLVIKKTPVDTGRARGNWFAEINGVSAETSETRTDTEAIAEAVSTAQKASGNIFTLTNNLDYIRRLEYGWSKQAPQGMVRLSIAEVQNSLKGF